MIFTVVVSLIIVGIVKAQEMCQGVVPGSNPSLRRWPMINSVTESSAIIVWGTSPTITSGFGVFEYGSSNQTINADGYEVLEGESFGIIHLFSVQVNNLPPSSVICYHVFGQNGELAGGLQFAIAPPRDSQERVTFTAIGDFGFGSPTAYRVRDAMWARYDESDMIIGLGDNIYWSGTPDEYQTKFFNVYNELLLQKPYYSTYGNHDYYYDGAVTYIQSFKQFTNTLRPQDNGRYFSFNWGPVHFLSICTELALDEADEHPTDGLLAWLEADLAAAANTSTWLIGLVHKVPYDLGVVVDDRVAEKVVPILEKYGVHALLGGHWHTFERYPPMVQEVPVPMADGGLLHVVTGGGGFPVVGDIIPMCGTEQCKDINDLNMTGYIYDPSLPQPSPPATARKVPSPAMKINQQHYIFVTCDPCAMTVEVIDQNGQSIDTSSYSIC